jgi:hypothetical protein
VRGVSIRRVDLVNDTTTVEVRYETAPVTARAGEEAPLMPTAKAAW